MTTTGAKTQWQRRCPDPSP
uniref:Uncharacterized protein n=1 Tax=Arundo donax TaxID=35708 RepID=A0A0A9HG45_ARUDO